MKCHIPEISWHNREPVLSVDFQRVDGEIRRLATAGVDRHVFIWHIKTAAEGVVNVEFVADLVRHDHSVNVVRFNPTGELLASGDDDGQIFVWKRVDKGPSCAPNIFKEEDSEDKENWTSACTLRGHVKDVYDLCWSPDGNHLISGSVDNSAILWDVQKGKSIAILSDHRGFVQGVAWDPLDKLVATLCSDRCCRVYNLKTRRVLHKIHKTTLPDTCEIKTASSTRQTRLFYDDTLKSFCRRLTFSPDGELLIAPTGIVETENENHINVTYIFSRHNLSKPALYFPTKENYTTVVRCCPVLFYLRSNGEASENKNADAKPWEVETTMFKLPYRIVFAVATQNAVILYDTQQRTPFGHVSNIHFTGLTDMSWSDDGRILIVSSTDGYCSFVTFSENELGIPYKEDVSKYLPKAEVVSTTPVSGSPTTVTTDKEKDVVKEKEIKKSSPVVQISSQPNVNKKRVSLITLFSPKLKSSIQVTSKNTTQVELPSVTEKSNQQNRSNDSCTKDSLIKPVSADDDDSIEITYEGKKQELTAQVSNMTICGAAQIRNDTASAEPNTARLLEKQSKTVSLPEPMEIDEDPGCLKEKVVNEKIETNQQDDLCKEKQMVTDASDDKMEVAASFMHAELRNIGDISKVNSADESSKETVLHTDVVSDDKMEVVTNVLNIELPKDEQKNSAEIGSVDSEVRSTGIETQSENIVGGAIVANEDDSRKDLSQGQSPSIAKIDSENINANESTLNTDANIKEQVDIEVPKQELTESSITKDGIVAGTNFDTSSVQLDNAVKISPAKVNQPQVSYTSPNATKPPRRVQLITLSTPPKLKDVP